MRARLSQPVLGVAALYVLLLAATATAQPVTVREVDEDIPTYEAGPPDPNPMFYFGRRVAGRRRPDVSVPALRQPHQPKVTKTYRIVYLENAYLKIGIAPEIGGASSRARQDQRLQLLLPAARDQAGAHRADWRLISGGVEWNIPHHHRASTFIPVQYRVEHGADAAGRCGSASWSCATACAGRLGTRCGPACRTSR